MEETPLNQGLIDKGDGDQLRDTEYLFSKSKKIVAPPSLVQKSQKVVSTNQILSQEMI